ncbi:MAG: transcriptional repressor [Eubacteriaceae bacterium]|nr:transcriptional repressor [Eubacteriaceae bacterium]
MSGDIVPNVQKIKELLKETGYKLTPQRRFIIDSMIDRKKSHLSIEEIFTEVKKVCPEIGIATVYRTVQLFEDVGIMAKQYFDDGCYRYEIIDDSKNHNHYHLKCNTCGEVFEIEDNYFDELESHIEKDKKFKITNHKVTFYGLCEKCSKMSG